MNGLIDYEVVAKDISEADAQRIIAFAAVVVSGDNGYVARPMAGDPVTGKSSGNWEVVKIAVPAPRLRLIKGGKFPARAGHEEQLGEVLP